MECINEEVEEHWPNICSEDIHKNACKLVSVVELPQKDVII